MHASDAGWQWSTERSSTGWWGWRDRWWVNVPELQLLSDVLHNSTCRLHTAPNRCSHMYKRCVLGVEIGWNSPFQQKVAQPKPRSFIDSSGNQSGSRSPQSSEEELCDVQLLMTVWKPANFSNFSCFRSCCLGSWTFSSSLRPPYSAATSGTRSWLDTRWPRRYRDVCCSACTWAPFLALNPPHWLCCTCKIVLTNANMWMPLTDGFYAIFKLCLVYNYSNIYSLPCFYRC